MFIGHCDCYGVTADSVEKAIVQLIHLGVTEFLNGGQGGLDRLCAGCVHKLQTQYTEIRNVLVIPYLSFNVFDKSIFDEIIYPEGFERYHFKAAITARNRYMVDHSAYAICYVKHDWGGTAQTYAKAVKEQLHIINLA